MSYQLFFVNRLSVIRFLLTLIKNNINNYSSGWFWIKFKDFFFLMWQGNHALFSNKQHTVENLQYTVYFFLVVSCLLANANITCCTIKSKLCSCRINKRRF